MHFWILITYETFQKFHQRNYNKVFCKKTVTQNSKFVTSNDNEHTHVVWSFQNFLVFSQLTWQNIHRMINLKKKLWENFTNFKKTYTVGNIFQPECSHKIQTSCMFHFDSFLHWSSNIGLLLQGLSKLYVHHICWKVP